MAGISPTSSIPQLQNCWIIVSVTSAFIFQVTSPSYFTPNFERPSPLRVD
ncbi:hypothetical protein HanRHA438_Chr10g0439551 [Helianthus annuus]|uniref:Uncharacterized protein n=1 Tax=Helianthus annuus TaxID=4232 RepID=A0A9K3N3G3_HELAN|nr:hypothetical protein HanXRQr2_Chr10g0426641 [Helianthus annuus]KAJ0695887.1 hypothetical protein HanLR1_Chr10g0350671 [Helianthus annuus]KAJ0878416.1 hypothetical protein HanRHA438_Chr10g0439551 [Helianthus annuus]